MQSSDAFNELAKIKDKHKTLAVLDRIEKRLNRLFRTEKEVFGTKSFKNIRRDASGKSRIVDVLIANDRDPVEVYVENALIACGRIRAKLNRLL